MMRRIIVIGAGAAGLMAGTIAALEGAKVLLLEKMNMVGKKMGITGKGRCNITNTCSVDELIAHTPGNGRFLYSAYGQFNNTDLLALLTEWKLAVKEERGGRVFPVSDSALEVRDMFRRVFKNYGGTLHLNEAVTDILVEGDRIKAVVTDKETYYCDAVILATGGVSYPLTGSTGDGHKIAEALGLRVTELRPSLIPLEVEEPWVKELMGLSLRNVELSVYAKGKLQAKQFGEMMFTHFGVTGPIVLSLSHTVSKLLRKKARPITLSINLKPALTEEVLDKRVQRDFTTYSKKQLANGLKDILPQRLIGRVIAEADLQADKAINQISREERQRLVHTLRDLQLTVKGTRPVAEAIVTAGGISVKEFSPKTMESKKIKGLYAAGEVLDIDAFTGGYNLQAAFSTGYVAAMHAAHGNDAE